MAVGILYQDGLRGYDFGEGHPFQGIRYELFYNYLKKHVPEDDNYRIITAQPATDKDLLLICHKNYVEFTRGYYESASFGISYPGKFNEFQSPDNLPAGKIGNPEQAARLVVGQAKLACQLVQEHKYKKVFSIGGGLHHARWNYGEGFCLYNDVAFCAKYLLEEYKLERILILDIDAHAGNGTYGYFQEEPRVLFVDLHQDPRGIYPGSGYASEIGSGKGTGFSINIPLPINAGFESYKLAFETVVEPVVKEYKPQIIIRNGGSDPHFEDSLTNLGLTIEGFRMISEKTKALAEICDGKAIDLIVSGYNMKVLPNCWLALIAGLAGFNVQIEEPVPVPENLKTDQSLNFTKQYLEEVRNYHKDYWQCFK
jgi:acetoin utilization protein AcuC